MFGTPRVTDSHVWVSCPLIHFAVKRVWLMSLFARYQSCLIVFTFILLPKTMWHLSLAMFLFCFAGERVLRSGSFLFHLDL
jgi:hypothetical protein